MFTLLKGLVVGNPWGSVILLAVLIGAGFSGGVWLESLIKNADISKLKLEEQELRLDAQKLQTQLAQARADAVTAVRGKEQELNARQSLVESWYQSQLQQKEKEHAARIAQDQKFAREHPKEDFVLPADTGLDWKPAGVQQPATAGDSAAKPDLPAAGGAGPQPDAGPAECRLSDLLADRDNWKDAFGRCVAQVKALQKKVLDDYAVINGRPWKPAAQP
jgi:hypothetical protein